MQYAQVMSSMLYWQLYIHGDLHSSNY